MPLYILPPPITTATWTPSSVMDLMSCAYWAITELSKPKLLSPINASPESLRRMRLYLGSMKKIFRCEDRGFDYCLMALTLYNMGIFPSKPFTCHRPFSGSMVFLKHG